MRLLPSHVPILLTLAVRGVQPAQACYYPDGTQDEDYYPCADNSDVCCKKGDRCLAGPICEPSGEASGPDNSTFYRANCASQSWSDAAGCTQYCAKTEMPYLDSVNTDQPVGRCTSAARGDIFYCKDGMESMVNCQQQMLVFTLTGWDDTTLGTGGATGAAQAIFVPTTTTSISSEPSPPSPSPTAATAHPTVTATRAMRFPRPAAAKLIAISPRDAAAAAAAAAAPPRERRSGIEDEPVSNLIMLPIAGVLLLAVLCWGAKALFDALSTKHQLHQKLRQWLRR